jgi:hypothetical protein
LIEFTKDVYKEDLKSIAKDRHQQIDEVSILHYSKAVRTGIGLELEMQMMINTNI